MVKNGLYYGSLVHLELIRPWYLNKLDNKQIVEWLISSKWYKIDIHLLLT